jgi:hypothetical protein
MIKDINTTYIKNNIEYDNKTRLPLLSNLQNKYFKIDNYQFKNNDYGEYVLLDILNIQYISYSGVIKKLLKNNSKEYILSNEWKFKIYKISNGNKMYRYYHGLLKK